MMTLPLSELFIRDLNRLKKEIAAYSNDKILWQIEGSIKNSGGNLCLHLIGNLKTYLGNGFAELGYVRQRDFEFEGKNVDREKLYLEIDETIETIRLGLSNITSEQLSEQFPIKIWGEESKMEFTLLHLYGHLNYHLGQVNYHRRMLDGVGV